MKTSLIIQELMFEVRKVLADWLHEHLLVVNSNYWREQVVPKLSFQQRAMVESRGWTSLNNLDFSGLLRVFAKNWYDIHYKTNLNPQLRAYLKELIVARNRYAHQSEEVEADEYLRDVDTLYRFARDIGARKELLDTIKSSATSHGGGIGRV